MSAIALFHGYLAARLLYFLWRVSTIVHVGTNVRSLCMDLSPLLLVPEPSRCAADPLESIKADLLFAAVIDIASTAFLTVTAIGLWHLQKWARNWLIANYGVNLAFTARALLFAGAMGGAHSYRLTVPAFTPSYVYLVIELTIFLSLLYSSGVPESFGEKACPAKAKGLIRDA